MSIAVFCGLVIFVLLAVMLLAGVPIAIALAAVSYTHLLALLTVLTIVIMFICINLSQKRVEKPADKCVQMPA